MPTFFKIKNIIIIKISVRNENEPLLLHALPFPSIKSIIISIIL